MACAAGCGEDNPPAQVRQPMLNFAPSEACGAHTLFVCCVAARNGDVRLAQIAPRTDSKRPGVSAASLIAAAHSNHIHVQPVRSSLSELLRWGRPAVLHVNGDHFIGMLGQEGGRLVVFDNSIGLIDCTRSWFDQQYRWDGVALVIGRPPLWRFVVGSYWLAPAILIVLAWLGIAHRRRGASPQHAGSAVPAPGARDGFTLMEILVVISIIGMVMALLLPAVMQAREAARRNQCANNLRNVGLAVQGEMNAKRRLPASGNFSTKGVPFHDWVVNVLPYIERSDILAQWQFDQPSNQPPNSPLAATRLEVLVCPDDNSAQDGDAKINYLANGGFGWTMPVGRQRVCGQRGWQHPAVRLQRQRRDLPGQPGAGQQPARHRQGPLLQNRPVLSGELASRRGHRPVSHGRLDSRRAVEDHPAGRKPVDPRPRHARLGEPLPLADVLFPERRRLPEQQMLGGRRRLAPRQEEYVAVVVASRRSKRRFLRRAPAVSR